jgi:hypothetical protein
MTSGSVFTGLWRRAAQRFTAFRTGARVPVPSSAFARWRRRGEFSMSEFKRHRVNRAPVVAARPFSAMRSTLDGV